MADGDSAFDLTESEYSESDEVAQDLFKDIHSNIDEESDDGDPDLKILISKVAMDVSKNKEILG